MRNMAVVGGGRILRAVVMGQGNPGLLLQSSRSLSTSPEQRGWLVPDVGKTAGHSSLITDKPDLYEIVVDDVKPKHWQRYIKDKGTEMDAMSAVSGNRADLVASWKLVAGDVNFRAMHLFRYKEGFSDLDSTWKALKDDNDYQQITQANREMLSLQTTEHWKSFAFWPDPDSRPGQNIYDVRSYEIRPGNMYDWSCYWSKGINIRKSVRQDIPYAGMFSQLGQLHMIYHIWCYTGLDDRKACRQEGWKHPEWNVIVSNTVPLVKKMRTRIMEPLPFSPSK